MIAFVAIAALVLSLLGMSQSGRSDATFTDRSSNPGSLFSSGTLTLTNTKDATAVLTASKLLPTVSRAGTLSIAVGGDYRAAVSLTGTGDGSALASALTLTIEDITTTATTLWTGTVAAFSARSTPLSLGTWSPGTTKTYRFTVAFPASNAAAALQNLTTVERLTFTGVAQ